MSVINTLLIHSLYWNEILNLFIVEKEKRKREREKKYKITNVNIL